MKLTGGEIEIEVFNMLKSKIKTIIKGTVYLNGTRPLNSMFEDSVITFITGLDNQIQTGALNINTYISDIRVKGNSDLLKDIKRCNYIERSMLNLINEFSVKTEYKFTLGQTIKTYTVEGNNQHFVNVKLKYERLS